MLRPPPPPPNAPPGRPAPNGPKKRAPLLGVLYILFFRPSLVFGVLERETALRSFVRVIGLAIMCGILLTVVRIPALHRSVGEWADWLTVEMDNLQIVDGQLAWESPQPLPYSKHFNNWRVSFVGDPETEFDPTERLGAEPAGIWISPTVIYSWQRIPGKNKVFATPIKIHRIAKAFAAAADNDDPDAAIPLPLDSTKRTAGLIMLLVGLGLTTIAGVVGEILFYVALFTFIPILLRSPQAQMGVKKALVFYLHLSLVPLIVAMVYAMARVPFLEFNTVFAIVFLAYLAFIVISARVKIRQLQGGGG